ncbi:hypothetical protein HZA55_01020 [Candidatus Poribacteria bacterium]|nr:hypothetical protein [Candidatus Poribacteria bacterium]
MNNIDHQLLKFNMMQLQEKTSNAFNTIKNKTLNKDEKAIFKACQDIESMFIDTLLKSMGKIVPSKDDSMGLYQDIMNTELSKFLSLNGGIGIANNLFEKMKSQLYSR